MVSVLIPIYNSEKFLECSINSVLYQSFVDFELILVDDASTDNSSEIIRSFNDPRIKFFQLQENLGIGGALNAGLSQAKGKYILRMDADDIAYPNRIEKQVRFMDENPEIGVSGTLAVYLDGEPFNREVNNDYLKPSLLLDCPFVHPTVIIRKEIMDEHDLQFSGYLEDYELWINLSSVTEFGLLPEVLLQYRKSENQFTAQNFERRQYEANKLRQMFAEVWLGRSISIEEKNVIFFGVSLVDQPSLDFVETFCLELLSKEPWNSPEASLEVVKKLFLRNYYRSSQRSQSEFPLFRSSLLSYREKLNLFKKSKLSFS